MDSINLLRGYPAPALLPVEQLQEASQRLLANRKLAEEALLYGPDAGWLPLLQALSPWLSRFYRPVSSNLYGGSPDGQHGSTYIPVDRLVATCGASQSLAVILNVFTDPAWTRNIWIVCPAYFLAFKMFEDAGFQGRLRGVPELHNGADVEWLRQELLNAEDPVKQEPNCRNDVFKGKDKYPKIFKHIIYVVPTFANPSSTTTSLQTREALVRCARDFDALVICDDVYDMLQWKPSTTGQADALRTAFLPRLVDIDRSLDGGTERVGADGYGNVISNGSFSKICGPGCRLGWVESTFRISRGLAECGTSKSGDTASVLMSALITELLVTDVLEDHIFRKLQQAYASRYRTLTSAVKEYLIPLGCKMTSGPGESAEVVGGYFIWIVLPLGMSADIVAKAALADHRLTVAKGQLFEVPDDPQPRSFGNQVRLSFAWEDEDKLIEGVKRLCIVIDELIKTRAVELQ